MPKDLRQRERLQRDPFALQIEVERLRELYEEAPVGLCLLTETGAINDLNRMAAQQFGLEKLTLLHQPFSDLMVRDDLPLFKRMQEQLGLYGTASPQLLRIGFQHVAPLIVQLRAHRDESHEGKTSGFYLSLSPVVQEALSEAERGEEKNEFRFSATLLNSIGEAVIATDMQGSILYWNKAAERIYGWASEEVLGRNIIDTTTVEASLEQSQEIMSSLQAGGFWSGEFLVRHRDGHTFIARVTDSCLKDASGQLAVIIGVSSDLTAIKELESQKEALQKELFLQATAAASADRALADAASQFKSEFIAHISHEMRTPLAIMRGFAELLVERDFNPESRAWIATIIRSSRNLELLVNDLLDISKIAAGKIAVEKVPVELAKLVDDLRSMLSLQAHEKGIYLTFSALGALPEWILTDPLRLKQIMINVIGNAIKFTETGGVKVQIHLLEGNSAEASLAFVVSDTGVGMSQQQAKNIFDAFHQADSSISRRYGGTGLGLSVSTGLAELLGGAVVLDGSEVNRGSTFTVTIGIGSMAGVTMLDGQTLLAVPTAWQPEVVSPYASLKGKKILLADDVEDIRVLVSFILQSHEADVVCAVNGEQAIQLAQDSAFDLILMDIQMPVMDGYEALRQLRAQGFTLPIFAVTAHAMVGEREHCLAMGFTDYLSKPLTVSDLIAKINQLRS